MPKRSLIGTIESASTPKTAHVRVERMKTHPLYGKRYVQSKRYAVHNPTEEYKVGDVVRIEEHRPISKTVRWVIRERISASNQPQVELKEEQEISELTDTAETVKETEEKSE